MLKVSDRVYNACVLESERYVCVRVQAVDIKILKKEEEDEEKQDMKTKNASVRLVFPEVSTQIE